MIALEGLTCPACGRGPLSGGLTDLSVELDLDGILRFTAAGLSKHRCGG